MRVKIGSSSKGKLLQQRLQRFINRTIFNIKHSRSLAKLSFFYLLVSAVHSIHSYTSFTLYLQLLDPNPSNRYFDFVATSPEDTSFSFYGCSIQKPSWLLLLDGITPLIANYIFLANMICFCGTFSSIVAVSSLLLFFGFRCFQRMTRTKFHKLTFFETIFSIICKSTPSIIKLSWIAINSTGSTIELSDHLNRILNCRSWISECVMDSSYYGKHLQCSLASNFQSFPKEPCTLNACLFPISSLPNTPIEIAQGQSICSGDSIPPDFGGPVPFCPLCSSARLDPTSRNFIKHLPYIPTSARRSYDGGAGSSSIERRSQHHRRAFSTSATAGSKSVGGYFDDYDYSGKSVFTPFAVYRSEAPVKPRKRIKRTPSTEITSSTSRAQQPDTTKTVSSPGTATDSVDKSSTVSLTSPGSTAKSIQSLSSESEKTTGNTGEHSFVSKDSKDDQQKQQERSPSLSSLSEKAPRRKLLSISADTPYLIIHRMTYPTRQEALYRAYKMTVVYFNEGSRVVRVIYTWSLFTFAIVIIFAFLNNLLLRALPTDGFFINPGYAATASWFHLFVYCFEIISSILSTVWLFVSSWFTTFEKQEEKHLPPTKGRTTVTAAVSRSKTVSSQPTAAFQKSKTAVNSSN